MATPFQRIADDRMHVDASLAARRCRTWTSTSGLRTEPPAGVRGGERTGCSARPALQTYTRRTSGCITRRSAELRGSSASAACATPSRSSARRLSSRTTPTTTSASTPSSRPSWAGGTSRSGRATTTAASAVEDDAELGVTAQRRTYNSVTGNLGALYRVADPVGSRASTWDAGYRAPTAFDLFSNGVHEGTVRFERGDSTLKNETSVNTDLAVRVQTSEVTAELGGFANYIDNFIFPDPDRSDRPRVRLPDLRHHAGRRAAHRLRGRRWSTTPPHGSTCEAPRTTPGGRTPSTDSPLPFIPPFRATYSVKLEGGDEGRFQHPYFSIGGESNARQTEPRRRRLRAAGLHAGEPGCRGRTADGRARAWRWTFSSATRSTRSTRAFSAATRPTRWIREETS